MAHCAERMQGSIRSHARMHAMHSACLQGWSTPFQALMRTMPLWLTVLVLLVTRLEFLGVREAINDAGKTIPNEPRLSIYFGRLFKFELTETVIFSISDILGETEGLRWNFPFLYIPFFLPFIVVSATTVAVFHKDLPPGMSVFEPFREAFRRCVSHAKCACMHWRADRDSAQGGLGRAPHACRAGGIATALFGSLVLVALLRNAEDEKQAPAYIIGYNVSDALGRGFIVIAAALGALGSFFSGSTTVSNLTFVIVHKVRARTAEPVPKNRI
jgi:lactate permease